MTRLRHLSAFILTVWKLLAVSRAVLQDDACPDSHHEIVSPRVISRRQLVDGTLLLRLILRWRHERLVLDLESHDITPGGSVSEWRTDQNGTDVEALHDGTTFYQGHIYDTAFSFAALSLGPDGLTGYLQIDNEGVSVEPLPHSVAGDRNLGSHWMKSCTRQNKKEPRVPGHDRNKRNTGNRPRRVRGAYTKYLEVLLVADTTVTDFVGKHNAKKYMLSLMNIVNTVYHHDSLGVAVEVVTVKIMFMDKTTETNVISLRDPKRTVDQFCYWASTNAYRTYNQYDQATNHDVAVLITRHNFAPAGYAPITGLCVPMRNCAFVKDAGFTSAFVIAHEIAHIFGLNHDGQGNTCYGKEYTNSLMATMVQSSFNHYWWSGCSRIRMAEVINNLPCLNNNPLTVIKESLGDPLGLDWTLDEQCRLEFGNGFRQCIMFAQRACNQMWCSDDPHNYRCTTKNVVPLEGTQCGPNKQWYCKAGTCSYHGDHPPVDGGWSQWTVWSDCSAGCGIGFKRRSRRCDSPRPEYNGQECDGESDNTDICKAAVCNNFEDMRATQCRLMDIVPLNGKTHTWLPYQVDKVSDQCKLTCKSETTGEVMTFDILVDNTTPCRYGDQTDICMDGTCLKVGCDGVVDSAARVDKCGECEGSGDTCKTVTGVYENTFDYSAANNNYEFILTIPKGARHIVIEEPHTSPHFLSLQDTLYRKHYLNGDGRQEPSKNFVMEGAWFNYVNYYGRESIKADGPLHGNVSVLLFPNSPKKLAKVAFNYTTDKDDFTYETSRFEWRFNAWSPCSVSCGKGTQYIVYGCYDKHKSDFVADDFCIHSHKRQSDTVECERIGCDAVKFTWRMLRDYSKCSASCGDDGLQHQNYQCERMDGGEKMDNAYCNHAPAPLVLQACNRKPCVDPTYRWEVTSTWTDCTASCGSNGTQFQIFYCVKDDVDDIKKVNDEFCDDLVSPKEPRPCNRIPCVSYQWAEAEGWDECSEKCGTDGMQRRKVICKQFKNGQIASTVGSWNCDGQEVNVEKQPCNVRSCFTLQWRVIDNWGECSHSCGKSGLKLKEVACFNVTYDDRERRVGVNHCRLDDRPEDVSEECNRVSCVDFHWEYSDQWTNCSSNCGGNGTQTQIQICISEETKAGVNEIKCEDKPPLQQNSRPCNREPCPQLIWHIVGDWTPPCPSQCQKSDVEQTREIACMEMAYTGKIKKVDNKACSEAGGPPRPHSRRTCEILPCVVKYRWYQTEEWGECSETCGEYGAQSRRLVCEATENNSTAVVNESFCLTFPQPEVEVRRCDLPSCLRFHETDSWTVCSQSCGAGVQQRVVVCYQALPGGGEQQVDMSLCSQANMTQPQRPCNQGPCSLLEFGVGPWSPCSKTCGPGQRKRIVYCGDPRNHSEFSRCPGKAPDEYENCNMEPCQDEPPSHEPATPSRRPTCSDRASFCQRANPSMCLHRTYAQVCCHTCKQLRKRRRRHWAASQRRTRHGRHYTGR